MTDLTNLSGPVLPIPDELEAHLGDPDAVRHGLALDMLSASPGLVTVTVETVASWITEIEYQSNVQSPDLLTLTIVDPDWSIQASGICDTTEEGIFNPVDINFPKGTDVWWRLNLVTNTGGDLTQPSLQLQFQHRLVSYLQADWGPLKVAPGTKTRAQFIKQLVDRIPTHVPAAALGPGSPRSQRIQFICPELNLIQPLDNATGSPTSKTTVTINQSTSRKLNKGKGISAGASLTAKGQSMTRHQIHIANVLLDQGTAAQAPAIAMYACIFDAIFESDIGLLNGWNSGGYGGPLGGNKSDFGTYGKASSDAVAIAQGQKFFSGGDGFTSAIDLAKKLTGVAQLGVNVTRPVLQGVTAPIITVAQSQYPSQGFPIDSAVIEAKAIVAAYGGAPGGTPVAGTATITSTVSDVSTLTRGTPSSPDEDSWTCMQRLAQAVNWELFTTAHPASGQWGNYLYFLSGPTNDAQMPAAYLKRSTTPAGTWDLYSSTKKAKMVRRNVLNQQPSYTVDNQTFSYRTTKKKHGKVQRAVATARYVSQTPTQIQLQMDCVPMEYNAGDVLYFEGSGPIDGRWIITETSRNMVADVYDSLYLGPPTLPTPEPTATKTKSYRFGGTSGKQAPLTGYVNPFSRITGLVPERIDMGVDYNAPAGSQILAIGNGKVFASAPSGTGWTSPLNTQAFVGITFSTGTYKGKSYYVAEDIVPTVAAGQKVKAGQVIATFLASSTGLETGWAVGGTSFEALAAALRQEKPGTDPGGWASGAGNSFNSFLVDLGAPGGLANAGGNGPKQRMPVGYP